MRRAGISGYLYGFEVVGGMGTSSIPANNHSTHSFGKNKNVVLHLTREFSPKKYKIFFDNLFTSLELLIQLKSMDMCVIGTLRQALTSCPLTTQSGMRKEGCGTMSQFVERKAGLLSVLRTITEELCPYPTFLIKIQFQDSNSDSISISDCRNGKMFQVPGPASADVYNRLMGGVDKADMLLSPYCRVMRSRKWYHRVVGYFLGCGTMMWLLDI